LPVGIVIFKKETDSNSNKFNSNKGEYKIKVNMINQKINELLDPENTLGEKSQELLSRKLINVKFEND
jgi:hypothetical protein